MNTTITIDFAELEKLLVMTARRLKMSEDDTDELRQNVVVAALEQKTEWQKLLQELVWNEAMRLKFSQKHDIRSLTELDDNLRFNDFSAGELDMFEQLFLAEEVQKVISTLPPKQQELCELLKYYSVGEACERMGLQSLTQLRRIRAGCLLRPARLVVSRQIFSAYCFLLGNTFLRRCRFCSAEKSSVPRW